MTNHQPPFNMPPIPRGGAVLGGPQQQPAGPAMQAQMVPRAQVQQGIYQCASMLSQAKAHVLEVAAILTRLESQCSQTADLIKQSDGLVSVGGMHLSPAQFAERFALATEKDTESVHALLELVRDAASDIPVEEAEQAALGARDE